MRVLNTVVKVKYVNLINNNLVGNFQLLPNFYKSIEKIDDLNYDITLYLSVKSTEKNPFPLDMDVALSGIFTFESGSTEQEIENFMNIPAIQIIFPHLRSLVTSVTASSYVQPLLLPLVDPRIFINK